MIKRVKIPEERLAVIIGTRGKTRKLVEKKTNTKITVTDEVEISGESLDVMVAENIVKAIGRGFSPENSIELLDEENTLLIIDLPKNEKELKRIKSRLIGTKGKSRRNLELLTKTKISIYGWTAGIIGKYDGVKMAEDAIGRLIKGISHKSVYEYLEKKKTSEENFMDV
jgi:ribosomal RNA assembly protein